MLFSNSSYEEIGNKKAKNKVKTSQKLGETSTSFKKYLEFLK